EPDAAKPPTVLAAATPPTTATVVATLAPAAAPAAPPAAAPAAATPATPTVLTASSTPESFATAANFPHWPDRDFHAVTSITCVLGSSIPLISRFFPACFDSPEPLIPCAVLVAASKMKSFPSC